MIHVLVADKEQHDWWLEADRRATAGDIIKDLLRRDGLPTDCAADYFVVSPEGQVMRDDELLLGLTYDRWVAPRTYVIGRRPQVHKRESERR
jgi:hypothetical protein